MTETLVYIGCVAFGGLVSFGYGWAVSGEGFEWRKAIRTAGAAVVAAITAYFTTPILGPLTPQTIFMALVAGFIAAKGADAIKDVKAARG